MPRKFSKPSVPSTDSDEQRRIYVLDTNVLMHDPAAIFRFASRHLSVHGGARGTGHHKKGVSESARNVRQVPRSSTPSCRMRTAGIDRGLPIPSALSGTGEAAHAPSPAAVLPDRNLHGSCRGAARADQRQQSLRNAGPAGRAAARARDPGIQDINLRIKAASSVHAEDYTAIAPSRMRTCASGTLPCPGLLAAPWREMRS